MAIPTFTMGGQGLDFSGIQNMLSAYQQRAQHDRAFEAQQRQLGVSNALAQGQFGLQREAADRATAREAEVRNLLSSGAFPDVPQTLVQLSRVTGDPSPIANYTIAKAKRKIEADGPEGYGKTGAVFQNPDGTFSAIQFGEKGSLKSHRLEPGMAPSRPVVTIDDGTGTQIVQGATGAPVRRIEKDIAGREAAEVIGKGAGAGKVALPDYVAKAGSALRTIDQAINHPGMPSNFGAPGLVPNLPGGQAANAKTYLDQLGGQAFLQAYETLRGGGAITEAEGQKATQAIARLGKSQSWESARAAMTELRGIIITGVRNAHIRAGLRPPETSEVRRMFGLDDDGTGAPVAPGVPPAGDGWGIRRVQ